VRAVVRRALPLAVLALLGVLLLSGEAVAGTGPPSNTSAPTVGGSAKDGSNMTSTTGHWAGLKPVVLGSQWMRCNGSGGECVNIPLATKTAYKATPEDIGHTLRVAVTATNGEGSASAASSPSPAVRSSIS